MADTIEKVYCTGDCGNDNLAAGFAAAVQLCTPGVEPAETER